MTFRPLLAALLLTAAAAQAPHLIPIPRGYTARPDIALPSGVQILCVGCDADDTFAAQDLRTTLAARGIPTDNPSGLRITLQRLAQHPDVTFTDAMRAEGYLLTSTPAGITLTGATSAGVFYAAQTVKQMIQIGAAGSSDAGKFVLHAADIRDYPAMPYRGLHDDLSRGPIDTLDFQKKLVRTLAAYKANLYSPYFENTQQYASNPLPAPPGGSISAADARELVAYAKQYHVTIVPEQEAFGHLHHILVDEQYAPLAETPHGAVLAPGQPGSLTLITQMFTELAQLYPGPFLHIGADETEDLGLGQTESAVAAQGLGPVYLNFMQQIDTALRPLNRRLLFWGDIAEKSPELLRGMSAQFKQDTIAISWHYNPSPTGFTKYLDYFKSAGFEFWVAPGLNNWSRVYPNYNNALPNIQQFTRDGQRLGATGQLNTIWYDDGEALASNNWYGILFGAAAAWQSGESSITDFQQSYGEVFHGDATGKLDDAQREIMACHDLLKSTKVGDGSDLLFWSDPWAADQQQNFTRLRPILSELRLHAERALTLIAQARAAYPAATDQDPGAPPSTTALSSARVGSQNALLSQPSALNPEHWSLSLPSNPTSLREPDAIDALELGARRLDFIGLKFQLADEISQTYARAQAASHAVKPKPGVSQLLSDINGINGRIQDIKDGYSLLRDLYAQLWLRTNRPYALRPVLEHYDHTIDLWLTRMDKVRTAQRTWDNTKALPSAADTGIPIPVR